MFKRTLLISAAFAMIALFCGMDTEFSWNTRPTGNVEAGQPADRLVISYNDEEHTILLLNLFETPLMTHSQQLQNVITFLQGEVVPVVITQDPPAEDSDAAVPVPKKGDKSR